MIEEKKKVLPLGVDDFREIRERNKYYVDKTLMIKDFIEYDNKVALITRPRRFGKTLNMTMLRDFFDMTQKSHDIFAGLKIMETKYAKQMNTVPVISLSLKGCTGQTVEELEASVAEEVFKVYKKYGKHLADVDPKDVSYLRFFQTLEILKNEQTDQKKIEYIQEHLSYLENSLAYLLEALHTFYGVRPIVLIDEYDNPIIEAHQLGFREAFTSFYATFLTTALKGNVNVSQALLTGIQRVAKESIFSKLNHLVVYNVLDEQYATYFGLTESETSALLEYYELELNDDVKSYYDGYLLAGVEIYNPWSILSYAQKKKLRSYWLKTSTNALIHESVASADDEFDEDFETLIQKSEVTVRVNLEASFTELPETETLWGLLINAGYLTVIHEDEEFNMLTVKIPNKEITSEFKRIVGDYTKLSHNRLQNMLIALTHGHLDKFLTIYEKLVLEATSYHDAKENAYHMLMLGMVMQLKELYEVTSNIESGYGRSDIIMKSKEGSRPHIVLEFKQGKDVEKLKHEALKQIHENKYYTGLKGHVLCIGIAHAKKTCQLVHEMITV